MERGASVWFRLYSKASIHPVRTRTGLGFENGTAYSLEHPGTQNKMPYS